MLDNERELFRWGPIPGRLIAVVDTWRTISKTYPGRLHQYVWPESCTLFYRGSMIFLSHQADLDNAGAKVFREVILTPRRKRMFGSWQECVRRLFAFCQGITKTKLRHFSNQELMTEWRRFQLYIQKFWEAGIIQELGAYGGAPILCQALKKQGLKPEEVQSAASILSAPEQLSFYQEEERDFFSLYKIRSRKKLEVALERHYRKYFWIENSYGAIKFLAPKHFEQRLRKEKNAWRKKQRAIGFHLARVRSKKAEIIHRYNLPRHIQRLSQGISLAIGWQDERKSHIFHYLHYLELFLREFSRRSGIPLPYLYFSRASEITTRADVVYRKFLRQRSRGPCAVLFTLKSSRIVAGRLARQIYRDFWLDKSNEKVDTLSGIVAHGGKDRVTGKVFIIRGPADLKRFPAGRILVTTMTAPEYITAIRRAKAIITDVGGITSHAAIVARELNIPCLVGTKRATRVLHTGERVIIDMRIGNVKKITT
ncbi:MAG: PEP-utilizing enzyme [Patescibacteria group bacterium]|nr:PEP-utilizing enzyme [Patescibacteria group bacterium]